MKIPSFYIQNFSDGGQESDLQKLLKNGTAKIVFRLFTENDEQLSLVAFSGKKNHKKFDEGVELKLRVHAGGKEVDLSNLNVFLGDMEIADKKNNTDINPIAELKRMMSKPKPDERYIIIEPLLPEGDGKYIIYQFYTLPDLNNQYRSVTRSTSFTAHPSPPYDGY